MLKKKKKMYREMNTMGFHGVQKSPQKNCGYFFVLSRSLYIMLMWRSFDIRTCSRLLMWRSFDIRTCSRFLVIKRSLLSEML